MSTLQYGFSDDGRRFTIDSPTAMPHASSFLWNRRMMVQATCRGFATAQFMQPEQPVYAHHPGRFCYVKDEDNGTLFSLPHEPVRAPADGFAFVAQPDTLTWRIERDGLAFEWQLTLPVDDVA